ncbi:hypothetical protein NEOLI_003448, partial [Neolecta irregularis DAH-3]
RGWQGPGFNTTLHTAAVDSYDLPTCSAAENWMYCDHKSYSYEMQCDRLAGVQETAEGPSIHGKSVEVPDELADCRLCACGCCIWDHWRFKYGCLDGRGVDGAVYYAVVLVDLAMDFARKTRAKKAAYEAVSGSSGRAEMQKQAGSEREAGGAVDSVL